MDKVINAILNGATVSHRGIVERQGTRVYHCALPTDWQGIGGKFPESRRPWLRVAGKPLPSRKPVEPTLSASEKLPMGVDGIQVTKLFSIRGKQSAEEKGFSLKFQDKRTKASYLYKRLIEAIKTIELSRDGNGKPQWRRVKRLLASPSLPQAIGIATLSCGEIYDTSKEKIAEKIRLATAERLHERASDLASEEKHAESYPFDFVAFTLKELPLDRPFTKHQLLAACIKRARRLEVEARNK